MTHLPTARLSANTVMSLIVSKTYELISPKDIIGKVNVAISIIANFNT